MVGTAWIFISFILGLSLGYLFFFIRYENRHIIDELRKGLKQTNKEKQNLQEELKEYKEQNNILKDKLTSTLKKNDDLSKVVSELSRYYYKIKIGSEKIKDLSKDLEIPDENILGQMQQYINENYDNKKDKNINNIKNNEFEKTQKKDFF